MPPSKRFRQLEKMAERAGLRRTPQRTELLRALSRAGGHPTAEQLYRSVKRRLPSVSPATVYRNVQILVEAGVLSVLERAGQAVQYDSNPEEHHHFVCRCCGRVRDVYLSGMHYTLDQRRSGLDEGCVESCEVQLSGICPECRQGASA